MTLFEWFSNTVLWRKVGRCLALLLLRYTSASLSSRSGGHCLFLLRESRVISKCTERMQCIRTTTPFTIYISLSKTSSVNKGFVCLTSLSSTANFWKRSSEKVFHREGSPLVQNTKRLAGLYDPFGKRQSSALVSLCWPPDFLTTFYPFLSCQIPRKYKSE